MREVRVDPCGSAHGSAAAVCSGRWTKPRSKPDWCFRQVWSHTGAAGLVLGGGTGWLTRRLGFSCDNVDGFTLVTADNSVVRANAADNADLFWALRGGGGNFGVVTEFDVRLHPLSGVVFAEGFTPEKDIQRLLKLWRDVCPTRRTI